MLNVARLCSDLPDAELRTYNRIVAELARLTLLTSGRDTVSVVKLVVEL